MENKAKWHWDKNVLFKDFLKTSYFPFYQMRRLGDTPMCSHDISFLNGGGGVGVKLIQGQLTQLSQVIKSCWGKMNLSSAFMGIYFIEM